MANRKGVFIGAYVPNHLKESLRRRAAAEHRTLSQEITRILEEAVHGKGLPPPTRRRAAGPMMRRTQRAETGQETIRAKVNRFRFASTVAEPSRIPDVTIF